MGNTPAPTQGGWYGVDFTSVYNNYWRRGLSTLPTALNYGLLIRPSPAPGVNRYTSAYSSNNPSNYPYPTLKVEYTPLADDIKIKLRWPLSTPHPVPDKSCDLRLIFECPSPLLCNDGYTPKKHNGTDYSAVKGTNVYAAEDGVVKQIVEGGVWKKAVVIEHNHIKRGKYTTVYWHVIPEPGIFVPEPGKPLVFVPKGMKIATVADLGNNTHFHFGVRLGSFSDPQSGAGALPPANKPDCDPRYKPFPGGFINPEDTSQVIYQ